jgi:hypothetical protein
MSALQPALLLAYQRAEYVVFGERDPIVTCIGQPSETLAALLLREGVDQAALLTACNPRSESLDHATNVARMGELKDQLRNGGWRSCEAEGRAANRSWSEASLLVLGLDAVEAQTICQRWQQHAWVQYDASGCGALYCTVL